MWAITKNNTECSLCHSVNNNNITYKNIRFVDNGNLKSDIYRTCNVCGHESLVPQFDTLFEYNEIKDKGNYAFRKLPLGENQLF